MPTPPYVWRHIATDPLHLKREPRYAVVRSSDESVIATYLWSGEAQDEARRLSILDGACSECGGDGSVIADWHYDTPIGETCPRCQGSGREPTAPLSEERASS